MPILPFYAEELGASATTLGVILAAYAAAQFVFAPLWGRLSDRVGRRPVMLMTIAGTALSLLALGLAPSLAWVLAARVLGGAFAANISVATAYVADVTDESERTRWMGMIGASFGIGFILGPAIGGGLAPFGEHVPLLAAAGLAAANWLHAVLSLREPELRAQRSDEAVRGGVLRNPRVRLLCLSNLAFALAVTQLESFFAFLMLHRFDYDASRVAAILVGMAVVMGGIQGGGMKALSARFEERRLVVAGCALLAGAYLWIPAAPSVAILLLPLLIAAVGRAVAQPALMSLASSSADAGQRGAVMGTFQASASLARVVGPIAGGWLYDREMGAPFVVAAVLLAGLVGVGRKLPARPPAGP